jgi:hypothetical protein
MLIQRQLSNLLISVVQRQIDLSFQVKSLEILWRCLLSGTYLKHMVAIYLNFRVKFAMMT